MSQWEKIELKDVCEFIKDGTHQTPKYSETGFIFLSSKNVTKGVIDWDNVKFIPAELHKKLYKVLKPQFNDILLAKNGTTGIAAIVDRKEVFDVYVSLAVLRPKQKIINPNYLLCAINSPQTKLQFDLSLKGIGVPNLHLNSISKTKIPLPPLETQRKIADNLDKVSHTIDICKAILEKLDLLVKARFVEMFGDPFNNNKWQRKNLNDVSISISDGSNVNKKYYQKSGDVLFFRIQNVWCNEFRLDDSVYISQDVNQKYIDTSLYTGDLLITKIGRYYTKDSSLGRVSVYLGKDNLANYSNNIMRVRLKRELHSIFVNYLLNLEVYHNYIKRVSVGGTDKRALSKAIIGDFPIIVPPLNLQKQFATFVEQIEKSKQKVKETLEKAETLKKALMQEYFG